MIKELRFWAFVILFGLLTISLYIYINPEVLRELNVVISPPISTPTRITLTPTPTCENRATSTGVWNSTTKSEPALIVFLIDEIRTRETLEIIFSALSNSLRVGDNVIILFRNEVIVNESLLYGVYPEATLVSPCSTPDSFFHSEWRQKKVSEFIELLRDKTQGYDFYSSYLIKSEDLLTASKVFRSLCPHYYKCIFVSVINILEPRIQFPHTDIETDFDQVEVIVLMTDCSLYEAICQDKTNYWKDFYKLNNANSIKFVDDNEFWDLLKNTIDNKP